MDVQYDAHLAGGDGDLAVLWLTRRLRIVAAQIPMGWQPRDLDFHYVPGTSDAAVHSARRHHPQFPSRRLALGIDPDLSDVSDPILQLAIDGILQIDPKGARRVRPH